jgi:hypothetical protein
MGYLKMVCGVLCFLILASHVWSMSRWSEARGVYDDICYLRQAHLFQKFGVGGLDTDLARDDDRYLQEKLKAIGFAGWEVPERAPCHTLMPAAKKIVIQYPPGTGFVLALFPEGFQVIPLYASATAIVFGFALLAIFLARSTSSILLTAGFGCLAVYFMINPTKASYSMAPTMVVCALVGLLTARLFVKTPQRRSMFLTMLIGFLIGLAVNFRLASLFLSAGYFLFFGFVFLRSRTLEAFLQGGLFGVAYLVGIAPTLIANAINAGSPFATTYGGDPSDLRPPTIDASILGAYFADMQGFLLILAGAWVVLIFRLYGGTGMKSVALVTALNLAVNVPFFLTHPTFNPYYAMPIAMLSLWSLLFASLMRPVESGDGRVKQGLEASSYRFGVTSDES